MSRARTLIPILAASWLVACATPPESSPTAAVQPIEAILAAGPQITDVGPTSVTLRAETTIAAVCAVVYGTTPDYGSIATDTDMAGGGHRDHHPVISGLQPDTLYYARLQGVGPDGTLYRSEELTFRTAQAESTAAETNWASAQAGATVAGVSSNYAGGGNDSAYGALHAIDGDPATAWSSDGDGDGAWIEIELARETHVTRVGLWTRTMGSSAQIETFRIVTDRGETVGPLALADASKAYGFETDFTARRLRFEVVTSSGGNTGAVEIEVFGEPVSD